MPALVYGHLLLALLVDRFLDAPACAALGAGVAGVWYYFTPWIYGIKISKEAHDARRWYSRWN